MAISPQKRSVIQHFLQLPTGGELTGTSTNWYLINEGVTELTETFNPETDTIQYIAEDSATTNVLRYAPSISLSTTLVKGDPVNTWIRNITNKLPVTGDTEIDTQYVRICLLDEINITTNENTNKREYTAYKRGATVSVDSIGGSAGDTAEMSVTINGKGAIQEGVLTITTTTENNETKTTYEFTANSTPSGT